MKVIALYARVSTTDKNQNPENQLMSLRKRCDREGWEFVEFVDYGSAFKNNPKLPQRDELLRRAKLQEFDGIMVWAIDRWSREDPVKVAYQIFYEIKKGMGVDFISLNEPFLSTNAIDPALNSIILQFISWAGSFESRRKSERVKAAYAYKKAKNKLNAWGRPSIVVNRARLLSLHEEGRSTRQIAEILNISKSTIARLLSQKGCSILIAE